MENKSLLIILIAGIGAVGLIGLFRQMKPGFGPFNLKVFGLTLVTIMASLLVLSDISADKLTPCFSILGAFAGYLFGLKKE